MNQNDAWLEGLDFRFDRMEARLERMVARLDRLILWQLCLLGAVFASIVNTVLTRLL